MNCYINHQLVPCDASFLLFLAIPFILMGLFFSIKPDLFIKYQMRTMKFFGSGTWKPNRRIFNFYRIFGLVFLVIGLIFLGMIFFNSTNSNIPPVKGEVNNKCSSLLQEFDNLVERSGLPITEDNNSLCHGFFDNNPESINPKFAVGKLMKIDTEGRPSLVFEGINQTNTAYILSSTDEISEFNIGTYYLIDMNNICRLFSMLVSSQSEPNITFTKPLEVDCSKEITPCILNETCQAIDCSGYGLKGIKEGYKPYCVENRCKCMCYGCE
jgi:hypothetical protein